MTNDIISDLVQGNSNSSSTSFTIQFNSSISLNTIAKLYELELPWTKSEILSLLSGPAGSKTAQVEVFYTIAKLIDELNWTKSEIIS
jgi:hypothetical protein